MHPHPLLPILQEVAWDVMNKSIIPNLQFFEEKQRSIENWICTELGLRLMAGKLESSQIRFEVAYPEPHKGRCDLVIGTPGESLWVEVAHIWKWTQSKWNKKCKNDAERVIENLESKNNPNQNGTLLLFLLSRPNWYDNKFESWINTNSKTNQITLINI